jgi:hypothetical protein
MLKWLIRKRLAAFERTFQYDMSYARDVLDADTRAFLTFSKVMGMSQYRRGVARDPYYAAKLIGVLSEDCGPCTQLIVTMGLRDGVAPATIAAVLGNDEQAMTDEVKLAVSFARASLAHDPEADTYREQVVTRWGARGLVSLAFALVSARIFPTLKYALGHGKTCQRVVVDGKPVAVHRAAA